ncbi:MAG TPA: ATP-binding protein, partial [Pyrinomonadaceae bacterium]
MRNFLADVQTRFLIAEFIRSQHHLRAASVIEVHHDQLGRIDFGDHMLRNAIAQVCVGHGLRLHELDDNERFPDLRDIRDEKVNLRFLAILLRLGDLLDMSIDRACPLLLSAASPLPPDSFPHWEQYHALTHRATSPQAIQITAECPNQEVHRVLQDWCQWIVDEINHAKIVIPKCQRHSEWQIPDATIEADNPTIQIRRAASANYVPSKWVLQFDQQAIFERLSENLYSSPLEFIRELIQNSLDALRCRMYSDLAREGQEIPEYPTQASEEFRNRYNVKLTISTREIKNQMSGETETKQILLIEDNGIGMDADIIEKYFLQVGRSYYTSDEFKRNFQFIPTSRFGIGFLSVFTVSDKIIVETYKPTSETKNNEPIRITLTGFRNYLLREKTHRPTAGTRIEITLRNDISIGDLTDEVEKWCKRVEFPILVNDFGEENRVTAEHMEDFIYEQPLVTNPNAKFVMRAFPVNRPGIEGELYVLAYIDEEGEDWAYAGWQIGRYSGSHPMAKSPDLVSNLISLHGITLRETESNQGNFIFRVDFRSGKYLPNLDRSNFKSSENDDFE